ncbi:MAG: tRNA (adenosine(37)-N6)-dimethylallyltransferase MiaA [Clostridia bacterium]|nr:tRNA (adenosine(37)-N6)-dimethylallyltransferase MiaA [Clostridia bacterium]
MDKLIAIVGTNASGKSSLGVELAARFNGEIVSADSRQVYRGLDLGSGKITPEGMKGVPHHLLDVVEPGEFFSMADFQKCAYRAIDGIISRGKLPFLVGGTGLYVDSVTKGYSLSDIEPDLGYREELETYSTPELWEKLRSLEPDSDIDPKNRNRVMRRLEKLHQGDTQPNANSPRYEVLTLGVRWDRETLKQRIDERLRRRVNEGMVGEVARLRQSGVSDEFLLKLGLEYRYVTQFLRGEWASEEEMLSELSLAIKRFAKRQVTWFKKDKSVIWLDMENDPAARASEIINEFLEK